MYELFPKAISYPFPFSLFPKKVHYGKAIRSNLGDIQAASDAVMAILEHSRSTDESSRHEKCPKDEASWCGYQQALRHNKPFHHKNPLPSSVAEAIEPTFAALSDKALLSKCMMGLTQNSNKALHCVMWLIAPKHVYHSPQIMHLAAALAIGKFNDGSVFVGKMLQRLGYGIGVHTLDSLHKADEERLRKARLEESEEAKERRKKIKKKKDEKEDTALEKEGVQYEPGAFGPDGNLLEIPPSSTNNNSAAGSKRPRVCKKCKQPMKGHKRGECHPEW